MRHLLTHTAGVPEWVHPSRMVKSGWFGESFGLGEPLPTLAEYYRGGLRLAVEPGTICTYTDHGFATLGQIIEDVSGHPLHRYLREHIFEPFVSPIPALYRGLRLHPDDDKDPYVFRIDLSRYGMGTARIVFSRDPAEATTGVHLDGLPLSAEKRPASRNPRLWVTGGAGALAVATAVKALRRPPNRPYRGAKT